MIKPLKKKWASEDSKHPIDYESKEHDHQRQSLEHYHAVEHVVESCLPRATVPTNKLNEELGLLKLRLHFNQPLCNGAFACDHFLVDRIYAIGKETRDDAIGGVERVSCAWFVSLASTSIIIIIQTLSGTIEHHQTSSIAQVLDNSSKNLQTTEHFVVVMMTVIGAKATLSPPVDTL